MEFEWDSRKDAVNRAKHGIGFAEAATIFGDPLELTIADPVHSEREFRFLSIGRSTMGQLLVVSYTEREQNRIRIISARKASRREQADYEQDHRR